MKTEQINELLNSMSLDEKIGQMLQLTGNFFSGDGLETGPMQDMKLTKEQVNNTGSILSEVGAAKLTNLQRKYMENQPHHIPMIFMADVINGYRTVFPIPLAQGCSFNPDLSKEMSRIAAKEAARAGLHVTFSPMVDLVRDARWGRVMESTGEDVYLNSKFCEAMVEGYQGSSIGEKDRISACIKHFAGYGAPVAGREYNQVELSERSLHEDYLPAYKAGVDKNARMVMTSFNTLGRIPSTGNAHLMQDILRKEWGFDGILISDWAAVMELTCHGVAKDDAEAAYLAVKAGVDIDMVTNIYTNNLKNLVNEGKVKEEWIDECVYRILMFKNELGLFENPFKDADEAYDTLEKPEKEHTDFARKALPETFVLLKNDGILPLPKNETEEVKSIAFVGPYMTSDRVCGSWSLFYNIKENVTLSSALSELSLDIKYTVSEGCSVLNANEHLAGFSGHLDNEITPEKMARMMEEAIENAKNASVVVMAIGEHHQMTGEGGARTEITIPEHQMELYRKIVAVNPNVVVVNFSGRPLDIREINKSARAILQVWFPGTETGHAVMDVLFGDSAPSGRLSMSFPYNVGQTPVFYSELNTGRRGTDMNNRFLSRYLDAPNDPLFVFGSGLDYTDYKYDNIKISKDTMGRNGDSLTVSVDVTNIGNRDGKEVVQMYIQDVAASVARPVRALKGFEKIDIKAGETKTVSFEITEDMLKFYDINMDYVAESGDFKVYVGHDCKAELAVQFVLE